MLRMTVNYYSKYSTSHSVYHNDGFVGSVTACAFHGRSGLYDHHDIVACFVGDYAVKSFNTITDAVKWLVVKEAMRNV